MRRTEMLSRLAAAGSVPLGYLSEQETAGDERDVILGIRQAPAAVVYVGQRSFLSALHGFREERLTGTAPGISGFLADRIDESGRHHFTLRTAQDTIDWLAAVVDPDGLVPWLPQPDPAAAPELAADAWRGVLELGPGVTRLDAYHSRPGGTRRIQVSFLIRPGQAAAVWAASGVEPEQPRLFALTVDGLRQVVREAVCDPGGDPPGGQVTAREDAMTSPEGPPFRCPVCGYAGLDEPPRTEESGPSYEICPSCGFEFGVTDDDRGYSYAGWRREWTGSGMRWWSRAHRKPPGWDPDAQLRALLASGSE